MAEAQVEAAVQTGATQDTATPADDTQSAGYTLEELTGIFRGIVQQENANLYAGVRQQVTPIQQKMAELDSIKDAIESVRGDNQSTRAMVKRLFAGTFTAEDAQVAMAAVEEEGKRDALAQENAKLKAEREARNRAEQEAYAAAQRTAAQWTPRQVTQFEWENEYGPRAADMAEEQGLTFADVQKLLPNVPEGATKAQWLQWERQAKTAIKAEADKRLRAEKPVVNTTAARPTSGAADDLGTNPLKYLQRHFETHPVARTR